MEVITKDISHTVNLVYASYSWAGKEKIITKLEAIIMCFGNVITQQF
jgi:hypothetical protein